MTIQRSFEDHHDVEQDARWSDDEVLFKNRLMENLELIRIGHYEQKDIPSLADWFIRESKSWAKRELIGGFEKMAYIIDIDWVISDKDWQALKKGGLK